MARKDILESMKEVLVQRREALRQAINGDDRLLKELTQAGGDIIDFASDTAFGELSSQLAEVESRELRAVDVALERMQQGTYGKCEACNCNIPVARLQVLPYATFCIECKRKAEKAGVEPGAVVDWSKILDAPDDVAMNDFNIS